MTPAGTSLRGLAPDALWAAVEQAARGGRSGAAGEVARLATVDGVARLGWVLPPPWEAVTGLWARHRELLQSGRLVLIGTGGWAFAALAAAEVAGASRTSLAVLDLLDPAALALAVRGASEPGVPQQGPRPPGDGSGVAVLAVSESGRTLETRLLADAVERRYGIAVRSLIGTQLSLAAPATTPGATGPARSAPDQVALFAAPFSTPFLLSAGRVHAVTSSGPADDAALGSCYRDFARRTGELGRWAAGACASAPGAHVVVRPPSDTGDASWLYLAQLFRQALTEPDRDDLASIELVPAGSEGVAWSEGVAGAAPGGGGVPMSIDLPGSAAGHPLVGLMERCYAAAALVACLGARLGLRFAEHRAVDRYKRLIPTDAGLHGGPVRPGPVEPGPVRPGPVEPGPVGPGLDAVPVAPEGIVPAAAAWLRRRPELLEAHLVCYQPELVAGLRAAAGELAALTGRRWEVHPGSRWNHHSYQAVSCSGRIGVVVVLPVGTDDDPLLQAQGSIASATGASLQPSALVLRPLTGTPGPGIPEATR